MRESCRWPSLPVTDSPFQQEGGRTEMLRVFADPPRRAHPSPRCCRNVSFPLCLSCVCLHLSVASKQADRSHLHYKSDKRWNASCQTRNHTKGENSTTSAEVWVMHNKPVHVSMPPSFHCSLVFTTLWWRMLTGQKILAYFAQTQKYCIIKDCWEENKEKLKFHLPINYMCFW